VTVLAADGGTGGADALILIVATLAPALTFLVALTATARAVRERERDRRAAALQLRDALAEGRSEGREPSTASDREAGDRRIAAAEASVRAQADPHPTRSALLAAVGPSIVAIVTAITALGVAKLNQSQPDCLKYIESLQKLGASYSAEQVTAIGKAIGLGDYTDDCGDARTILPTLVNPIQPPAGSK
jgi:hypothetical protein